MTNHQLAQALAFITFLVFCATVGVGAVTFRYATDIDDQERTGWSDAGAKLRRLVVLLNFLVLAMIASGGAALYYWMIA